MDAPSLIVDSRANCLTLGFEIVDDLGAHVERPKLAEHSPVAVKQPLA